MMYIKTFLLALVVASFEEYRTMSSREIPPRPALFNIFNNQKSKTIHNTSYHLLFVSEISTSTKSVEDTMDEVQIPKKDDNALIEQTDGHGHGDSAVEVEVESDVRVSETSLGTGRGFDSEKDVAMNVSDVNVPDVLHVPDEDHFDHAIDKNGNVVCEDDGGDGDGDGDGDEAGGKGDNENDYGEQHQHYSSYPPIDINIELEGEDRTTTMTTQSNQNYLNLNNTKDPARKIPTKQSGDGDKRWDGGYDDLEKGREEAKKSTYSNVNVVENSQGQFDVNTKIELTTTENENSMDFDTIATATSVGEKNDDGNFQDDNQEAQAMHSENVSTNKNEPTSTQADRTSSPILEQSEIEKEVGIATTSTPRDNALNKNNVDSNLSQGEGETPKDCSNLDDETPFTKDKDEELDNKTSSKEDSTEDNRTKARDESDINTNSSLKVEKGKVEELVQVPGSNTTFQNDCEQSNENLPVLKKPSKKRGRKKESKKCNQEVESDKVDNKIERRSSKRTKLSTGKAENEIKMLEDDNDRKQLTTTLPMESSIDNCVLLHAAIHDPLRVLNDGPGLWMLDELFRRLKIKPKLTDDEINLKWRNMMHEMHCTNENESRSSPCQHLIKDVLTICFASKSAEAQCVALVAAGWTFVPTDKSQRRRSKTGAPMIYKTGKWSKDGTSMPLQEAWDEYVNNICDQIDEEFEKVRDELIAVTKGSTKSPVKKKFSSKPTRETVDPVVASKKAKESVDMKQQPKKAKEAKQSVDMKRQPKKAKEAKQSVDMKQQSKEPVTPKTPTSPVPLMSIILNVLTDDQIPSNAKAYQRQRKGWVRKSDPRPVWQCSWCGPKLPEELTLKEEALCEACMFLYEEGWRFKRDHYVSKGNFMNITRYFDTEGKEIRSCKAFLETTTSLVSRKFRGCVETDSNKGEEVHDTDTPLDEDDDEDNDSSNKIIFETVDDVKKNGIPKLQDLVLYRRGLAGVLQDDKFCLLNLCYGSDVAIAFLVLKPLILGTPPDEITDESKTLSSFLDEMHRSHCYIIILLNFYFSMFIFEHSSFPAPR